MDISLAFVTGLLSSLHCAGMCGPLVAAYSTAGIGAKPFPGYGIAAHLLYNAGRICSYAFVGGILAIAGGSLSSLRSVGFVFSVIIGTATTIFGIIALRGRFSFAGGDTQAGAGLLSALLLRLVQIYQKTFGALVARRTLESKLYIGLLTPLLPCGLLYGMLIRSAGAGSPWEGAMMMTAFGLGIVPSLLAAGLLASYISGRVRVWAERLAASMLIVMGLSLLWRALAAGVSATSHGMS